MTTGNCEQFRAFRTEMLCQNSSSVNNTYHRYLFDINITKMLHQEGNLSAIKYFVLDK